MEGMSLPVGLADRTATANPPCVGTKAAEDIRRPLVPCLTDRLLCLWPLRNLVGAVPGAARACRGP